MFTKARKSPFLGWQVYEASGTCLHSTLFEVGADELICSDDRAPLEQRAQNCDQHLRARPQVVLAGPRVHPPVPRLPHSLQQPQQCVPSSSVHLRVSLTCLLAPDARALFERTVALVEPAKAKPVWDRMSQYEYQYGDFLAAQKIFQRYSEAFPEGPLATPSRLVLSLISPPPASPIERFAQRHGYLGLDDAITQDLGLSIASNSRDAGERRSRSPSPRRLGPGKRGSSVEPRDAYERGPSLERAAYVGPGQAMPDYGAKRLKQHHPEGSPAPSSTGGGGGGYGGPPGPAPLAGGWGRAPREEPPMDDYDLSRSGRRRPLDYAPPPHLNRPVPYALDSRGETVAILPDAIVFFLSILPGATSFNGAPLFRSRAEHPLTSPLAGPMLNPTSVVDVIGTTLLPGTAPGPGLPGERLGIPPRPKPPQHGYGGESPRRGGGGGGGKYPACRT